MHVKGVGETQKPLHCLCPSACQPVHSHRVLGVCILDRLLYNSQVRREGGAFRNASARGRPPDGIGEDMKQNMRLQHEPDAFKDRWTEPVGPESRADDARGRRGGAILAKVLKAGDAFPSLALSHRQGRPFDMAYS